MFLFLDRKKLSLSLTKNIFLQTGKVEMLKEV